MTAQRRIGFVGFQGVNAFDLTGPTEVFATANAQAGERVALYELHVVAPDLAPLTTESGLVVMPAERFEDAPAFDTIVVCGGPGLREPSTNQAVAAWLRSRADTTRRIASVCTGFYGLAASGLLDGRRATTHWRWAAHAQASFPAVKIEPDLIYVRDGAFYTSGGISAGVDLALALVEEDLGPRIALAVAREMLVYMKRTGGQSQYSEPLKAQSRAPSRLADLTAWIAGHLDADLSVETLADRAALSPRQLSRLFKETLGVSPATYVEHQRLDAAREVLTSSALSIDAIAALSGYRSADVFRRSFERSFGVSPSQHRRVFSPAEMSENVGETS
ncbi:MAG: GlxA family transcriptional regulator [Caulobacterales bacterium]